MLLKSLMDGGGKAVENIFFDRLLTIYSQLFDRVIVKAPFLTRAGAVLKIRRFSRKGMGGPGMSKEFPKKPSAFVGSAVEFAFPQGYITGVLSSEHHRGRKNRPYA